jgi:hypothetical protein
MTKLCFFTLLLIGCASKSLNNIKQANVTAASFGIETPFALNCEQFETNLTQEKQTKVVKGEKLAELSELLTKSDTISKTSIDVRGELLITFQDNKNEKLCFNKFGVFHDGMKYIKNERLLQFLFREKLAIP